MAIRNAIPASRTTLSGGYKYNDADTYAINKPVIKYRGGAVVTAEPVNTKAHKPRIFAEERFCSEPDCNTKLSKYNKGPECYQHSPTTSPRIRGKW